MASLAPGAEVVVVGSGPVLFLVGKLAALAGYKTTVTVGADDAREAAALVYDERHPEGSLPLAFLPIAGPEASQEAIDAAIKGANGLIIAFDAPRAIPEEALNVFMPLEGGSLQHVAMMSRSLTGRGMGFTVKAAKFAANAEIWDGNSAAIDAYKEAERVLLARAQAVGDVTTTFVRAGTLKGGGSADCANGGSGVSTFLNPYFYTLGQQDVVNWRLLYDCGALGVKLLRGDVLPGPGFTAALTATSETGGDGDSHRGAVATALVESLSQPAALDGDFSVGSEPGRSFPSAESWATMFANA